MSKYVEGRFVTFKREKSNCQVDCYHNRFPGELHVGKMVDRIAKMTGRSSVFANFSREVVDLNREADGDGCG